MARPRALNVVTYNIHKGLSQFNRRLVLHEIRDRLGSLESDVAFLQEVQGRHESNARRHVTWPNIGQHEFLTHEGSHCVYGMNAVYQDGHHGNAIVSRHPIPVWENIDVSHHPLESRGLLHCEIAIEGRSELGLYEVFERLEGRPARSYPAQMPLFTLDRIYVRDMNVDGVQRHVGSQWSRLSDHVALAARLTC